MWRIRRDVVLAASCVVFWRGFLGDVGADASAVAVLPAWGDSARHRFGLSGGCGMLCSDFLGKNGGISYCFFGQTYCRSRRRCLTAESFAAVAASLTGKTVRNPPFLIQNSKHYIQPPPGRKAKEPDAGPPCPQGNSIRRWVSGRRGERMEFVPKEGV